MNSLIAAFVAPLESPLSMPDCRRSLGRDGAPGFAPEEKIVMTSMAERLETSASLANLCVTAFSPLRIIREIDTYT